MTTSKAHELTRRGRQRDDERERMSFPQSLSECIRARQAQLNRIRFPHPRYQHDPVRFFREVLGVEPWEKQAEALNAVRDHTRVAIKAGHKVSKSHTFAGLALWFYCSFADARAIMTSTTSRQVDQILWRETRMVRARSGRCTTCKADDPEGFRIATPCPHSALIEGEMGDMARTGLKAPDFREIVGFTAREAEAVAGISGANLIYLVDEASGVPDVIFEAIEGNRAGGARIVLAGNPTRNEGEFFDAFHSKSRFYHCITISSEQTPNVIAKRVVIPGLATHEWVEEKKDEWGEDSPLYKIRIQGEFALSEEGKIFSVHAIEQAEIRWYTTPEAGRLYIGVDPAGETGTGDESMLAVRRGLKCMSLHPHRGVSAEAHVTLIVKLITETRLPREVPVVVIDAEGPIGLKVARQLGDYLDEHPNAFELVRVYASQRAYRLPMAYERVRDELAANLETWFRDGGAIPEDTRLEAELHAPEWIMQPNGRVKCTPKDVIRKALGRSPDRYDALALSAWEPLSLRTGIANDNRGQRVAAGMPQNTNDALRKRERTLDPYAASTRWRGDR